MKLPHTKANIRYAERLRGEILNAIELGTFSYVKYFPDSPQLQALGIEKKKDPTIGELLDEQFKIYERTLTLSTISTYRRNYSGYLYPRWGKTLLSELTPAALRQWLSTLDVKAATVNQILVPLRGALESAINDDLIEANPMDRVKLRKILPRAAYKSEYVADPFSANEIQAILKECDGQVRNVLQFAFATGMRPSEYIALRWDAIDWTRLTVQVKRVRVAGEFRDETKTAAGRRLVDLRRGAYDALISQKQYSALANDLIFLDPSTGSGWNNAHRVGLSWEKVMRRSGVRRRNLYQTRHTFASTLLSTSVNAMYVAKQMGHTDTTMVTRTYGKWIEQDDNVLPDFYHKVLGERLRIVG